MRIAVCLGGYSGVPKHNVTVLDGIRQKAGKKVKVLYSEGLQDHHRRLVETRMRWSRAIRKRTGKAIAEAVRVAKKADVIVLANRRKRADLARGLEPAAYGRPHQP